MSEVRSKNGERVKIHCKVCGKAVYIHPCRVGIRKTCSRKCGDITRAKAGRFSKLGSKNPNWNGGRFPNKKGYWVLNFNVLPQADQEMYAGMAYKKSQRGRGYILEHRYLMARRVGRPLERNELVHHLNGIRSDNRLENLELLDMRLHSRGHGSQAKCPRCGYEF